ncbi:helix-turn-helix domain-containing protein [Streptomyces beijiangensis]|uniref:helix-turn-helix domain-containing protein n=1 Tax=Streptomyces beijiangensis TaxID=163361 RepID=UPI001F5C9EB3|nr:helix-turn-helix domain-containing protein [Streptomyces beijiangensis]
MHRDALSPAPPRLYRPEEIAAVLGCSVWWVKDRARRRSIPFTRVGRAYRFSDDHLAEIIGMHEERPTERSQYPGVAAAPAPKRPVRQRPEAAVPTVRLKSRPPRRLAKSQYGTAA